MASSSSLVRSMWSCQVVMILAVSFPIPDARVSVSMGALRMASAEPSSSRSLRTLTGPIFGSMLSAIVASRLVILLVLMVMKIVQVFLELSDVL